MKRSLILVVVLGGLSLAGGCGGGTPVDSDGTGGGAGEGTGGGGDDEGTGGEAADGSGGEETDGSGGTSSGSGASSGVGGSTGGMGGMGGTFGAAEFCEEQAAAYCSWSERCRDETVSCEEWGGYILIVRECEDALASLEQGYLEFHQDVALACVEAAEGAVCAGPPFIQPEVQEACTGVFVGTVPLEGDCTLAGFGNLFDECAEGFCLRSQGPTGVTECVGTCTAYKTSGETCAGSDRCAEGLYCMGGECSPPLGVGEDCAGAICEDGLVCSQIAPTTCRQPGEVGADCSDDYDCAGVAACLDDLCALEVAEGEHCRSNESCAEGLYCNYEDQLCTPFLGDGDTCDSGYDQCVDGYACSSANPSTCVVWYGAENDACGAYGCEEGLWCDQSSDEVGVCIAKLGDGADCNADTTCQDGLYCMDDGNCHAPGELDDPCSVFTEPSCVQGLFCDRETVLCKEARAEDETCNPGMPLTSCQEGLYCACLADECPAVSSGHDPEDVCVLQLEDGEYCTSGEECVSGFCSSTLSECAEPPPANCSR